MAEPDLQADLIHRHALLGVETDDLLDLFLRESPPSAPVSEQVLVDRGRVDAEAFGQLELRLTGLEPGKKVSNLRRRQPGLSCPDFADESASRRVRRALSR
ncbi:MAG: hypothetical protein QM655_16935 [Nocardioidaceae bacterium]